MSSPEAEATTEQERTGGGGTLRQEEIARRFQDGVYRGPWRGGKPHGQGELTVNGNVYVGTFVQGKFTGHGEWHRANGEWYRGQFVDRAAQGYGEMTYVNGDVYKGTWKRGNMHGPDNLYTYAKGSLYERYSGGFVKDKMQGRGRLVYVDGSVYDGEFKNDKKNGTGEMTHADGNKYNGSYKNDRYHGSGHLEEDGNVYTGNFVNGLYHGRGEMKWANGTNYETTYEGGWAKGKYHGEGTLIDVDHKYEGSWVNGKEDGEGKITYFNGATKGMTGGDTLAGKYEKGEIVEGTYTFVDGEVYVGQFAKGKYHGRGIFSYRDGSSYEGDWYNDERHGQGTLTDADGNILEGTWVNGKKHGAFISRCANGDVINKMLYRDDELASSKRRRAGSGSLDATNTMDTHPPSARHLAGQNNATSVLVNESPASRPRVDGNLQPNIRRDGGCHSSVVVPLPQRSSIQPLDAGSSPVPMPAAAPLINHEDAGSGDPGDVREEAKQSRQGNVSNVNDAEGDGNVSDSSDGWNDDYKALCMQLTEKVNKQKRRIRSLERTIKSLQRGNQAEAESLQADNDDDDIRSLQMMLISKLHFENEKLLKQTKGCS